MKSISKLMKFFGVVLISTSCASEPVNTELNITQVVDYIWQSSCAYCHVGNSRTPELLGRQLPAAFTSAIVRSGAPGMPVFHESEITQENLEALSLWIQETGNEQVVF